MSFENPTGRVVLFLDEIHRLNKNQQDVLLPYIEEGKIILIGATAENPYHSVNNALLSRSTVFRFEKLTDNDVVRLLKRAVEDKERGLGEMNIEMQDKAFELLAELCNGDARAALNALELAAMTTDPNENGKIVIDETVVEECIQRRVVEYDKAGDNHYDVASAFIKSMRNYIEPDAVLHYLARMIEAGEKPEFIARRIMISAAEDVGLANPAALTVAVAAAQAVEMVGWPESRIILAMAALTVACSSKSNSAYMGINSALNDVQTMDIGSVPKNLLNEDYEGAVKGKESIPYKYSHDYPNARAVQQYMPDNLKGKKYYIPKESGAEAKIRARFIELFGKDYFDK